MNDLKLREALHEVASAGAGEVHDVRLARMAAGAREVGRRVARRRWFGVAGAVVATTVVVLLVAGVFAVARPVEVVPASGTGSLPDRIFPTREHILTLDQAPIGRVSMVYATQPLSAQAADSAWIAVGADTDEYRWVDASPDGATPPSDEEVQVSPGGTQLALSSSGDSAKAFGIEIVDAITGQSTSVLDGQQAPLGGEVDTLSWSPDGDALFVGARVVVKRLSVTARRWESRHYVISGVMSGLEGLEVEERGEAASGQMVGWSGNEPVFLLWEKPTMLSKPQVRRYDLVVGTPFRVVGRVPRATSMTGGMALSPDGRLLASLVDPTANASGDGRPWRLQVFDTESGEMVWQNRDVPEDASAIVGWRNARTPVLYTATPGGETHVAEYSRSAGEAVRIIDLEMPPEVRTHVSNAAVAADVLSSGNVRVAEPPHQPWYDPRTMVPTVRDWVSEHPYTTLFWVITALSFTIGIVQFSLRRRAARSR